MTVDRQKNSLQQQLVGLNHRLSLTEQQLEGVRREKALGDERYDLLQKEKKDLEQRRAVRSSSPWHHVALFVRVRSCVCVVCGGSR
jgi:alpha-galactosidase/6-phospho-beta-glucosidase family protein